MSLSESGQLKLPRVLASELRASYPDEFYALRKAHTSTCVRTHMYVVYVEGKLTGQLEDTVERKGNRNAPFLTSFSRRTERNSSARSGEDGDTEALVEKQR